MKKIKDEEKTSLHKGMPFKGIISRISLVKI